MLGNWDDAYGYARRASTLSSNGYLSAHHRLTRREVPKTVQSLAPCPSVIAGAPANGVFEHGLRLSVMYVVGGGTNDIQRGLIARALGLPC
jgi:hypothetical protein